MRKILMVLTLPFALALAACEVQEGDMGDPGAAAPMGETAPAPVDPMAP